MAGSPKTPAWKQAVIIVFFLALLATPAVVRALNPTPTFASVGDGSGAVSKYGVSFREVSKEIGIDFVHRAPTLDPKIAHIMPIIASMGAAVAVVDFDRDGWNDLYVTDSSENGKNRLYRNLKDGKFEDVAMDVNLAVINDTQHGCSMGSVWGDYDNDGFEDVLIYRWGRPELFHNEGGKSFTRMTDGAGLPQWVNANSAIWFDYDRDGLLDLFIGGYYRDDLNLWNLQSTRIMPESFKYAKNGGRKYLLKNLGGGKFSDVTEAMGVKSTRWALAAGAADLLGTGYPDLVIANDYGVSEMFANQGGKRFVEVGHENNIGERPTSGMNVAFGDYANTGRQAIYITNIYEDGKLVEGNNFWNPRAGTEGRATKYDNIAADLNVAAAGWCFGAQFGDLNNDGWLDLFATNGFVSQNQEKSYWYNYSEITGGNTNGTDAGLIGNSVTNIISEASNWPEMNDMSLSGFQRKTCFLNQQGQRFVDVAPMVGINETHDGRSVAFADLWNRGALDMIVAHHRGPLLVYKNEAAPENRWVSFDLEGGPKSNRSAIGASVTVQWNGMRQVQNVEGGSGFCAQNMRRLHFGLGKDAKIDKVVVRWPSGREQTLEDVEIGKLNKVKEPA